MLRPYQSEGIDLIRRSFQVGNKRIIRCAPTGSGKSHEIAEMVRLAFENNKRVILLTHRQELFRSTLSKISNIPVVQLDAGADIPASDWRVMMAMEATLWNRIRKKHTILAPDLIIADEIHFNNFTKILEHFDCRTIGFTATPQGKHLAKLYTDIIDNVSIADLIKQGYLVPCRAFQMQDEAEISTVKIKGGEFDESDLFKHFNKSKLYTGLIEEYRNHVQGEKGIVFCINIEHCVNTYNAMKEAGINVFMAHSGNEQYPAVRQFVEFEVSDDGVLINAGIATTGYDHPAIRWVGLYRATTSLPLFLQMIGRGSRPDGDKKYFTVLDFGRNHERHGLWSQPREWSLKPTRKKSKQAAPSKGCPGCGALLYASAMKCEFCGHQFPKPTHDFINGVMVEVLDDGTATNVPIGTKGKRIGDLSIEELISLQRTKKFKSSMIWRILRSREAGQVADPERGLPEIPPSPCLSEYAGLMGYQNGWLFNQRKKIQDGEIGFKNYIIK